jgi:hypothetical protein
MPRRKAPTEQYNPIEVATSDLLKWIQLGDESGKQEVRDAADSLRSLLVFKLRERTIWIDSDMMQHYVVLHDALTN